MTDQTAKENTANTPPPLPQKRNKLWRVIQIAIGIILGAFLLLKMTAGLASPDLELLRTDAVIRSDGMALQVTNVGRSTITINDITVNDRPDCTISVMFGSEFSPITLKVGDRKMLISACQIIRANVKTDQGSGSYSFSR